MQVPAAFSHGRGAYVCRGGSTHSGEALLSALQAGCAGAGGVRAGVLRAAELSLLLPRGLVLPPHFRGLAQASSGGWYVVHGRGQASSANAYVCIQW